MCVTGMGGGDEGGGGTYESLDQHANENVKVVRSLLLNLLKLVISS